MTIPSTYTLWKHNDKVNRITYSVTFRPGWTPAMLAESRQHYVAANLAARNGQRTIETLDHLTYVNSSDEPIIQIFGDVAVQVAPGITRNVTINCFDENASGQQLLDELWAIVDAMNTLEAVEVLAVATEPQPATLRPSQRANTAIDLKLARANIDLMAYIPAHGADDDNYEPSYGDGSDL